MLHVCVCVSVSAADVFGDIFMEVVWPGIDAGAEASHGG